METDETLMQMIKIIIAFIMVLILFDILETLKSIELLLF